MNKYPINEKLLLISLPGFGQLTEQELENIRVVKVEYNDHLNMFSFDLFFEYLLDDDTSVNLKFEMMGNRLDDHVYRHILYEDYTQELEFGSIQKALKYFKESLIK